MYRKNPLRSLSEMHPKLDRILLQNMKTDIARLDQIAQTCKIERFVTMEESTKNAMIEAVWCRC